MKRILTLCFIMFFSLSSLSSVQADESVRPDEIESIDKAGTYFITIFTNDNGTIIEQQIPVVITFQSTVVDESNNEGIDASDFRILIGEDPHDLSTDSLIAKSNAYAWDLDTNQSIPITSAIVTNVRNQFWEVTFSTAKETSISVNVTTSKSLVFNLEHQTVNSVEFNITNYQYFATFVAALMFLPFLIYIVLIVVANRQQKEVKDLLSKKIHTD